MRFDTVGKFRSGLALVALASLLMTSCGGGGDGETTTPEAPAAMAGTEGGGNGGSNGGGNGGGEAAGLAIIKFPPTAKCGVDFASISPPQLELPANQRKFEIFSPCGPDNFDSFTTNDGAINVVAEECTAGARAIYEAMFGVTNSDCG